MTDKYTADDFKQSRFANHPQRGVAARARPGKMWAWIGGATEERFRDDEMVSGGWSPVHECPNPSRHESPDLMDGGVTAALMEQEGIRPVDPEGDAAFWRARAEKAERAAQTLGKVVEDQCRDIARITRSEHLVDEDGDADWGAIWERGHDMATRLEEATDRVDELRDQLGTTIRADRAEEFAALWKEAARRLWFGRYGVMRARDEWKDQAITTLTQVERAERDLDALRERIEQPRPFATDDVDDAMVERAEKCAVQLRQGGLKMNGWVIRQILTAALTPEPTRPEGAEALTGLINDAMRAQGWKDDYATLADHLAEQGVRIQEQNR